MDDNHGVILADQTNSPEPPRPESRRPIDDGGDNLGAGRAADFARHQVADAYNAQPRTRLQSNRSQSTIQRQYMTDQTGEIAAANPSRIVTTPNTPSQDGESQLAASGPLASRQATAKAVSKAKDQPSTQQNNHFESQARFSADQQLAESQPENGHDWQAYHSAWQRYYQQYYHQYYTEWWRQQEELSQIDQRLQPPLQAQSSVSNSPLAAAEPELANTKSDDESTTKLRSRIRKRASHGAQRIKKSSHFKPALAALVVAGLFLFVNYNQLVVGAIKQYVAPGNIATTPVIVEPSANLSVGPEPKIIIPKIGVDAAAVFDEPRVDEPSFQAALDRGVVRLGTTADPGTIGNTVIGGHSSNNIFNQGRYKFVFIHLRLLKKDDVMYVHFNSKRYTYKVSEDPFVVAPTDVGRVLASGDKPELTLFTCDPPGNNVHRLIIKAELIDPLPDQSAASPVSAEPVETNPNNPLPSVAPSIWDRIKNIF